MERVHQTKKTKIKAYYSARELGERYDVSRSTIWRMVQDGRLPQPVKFGRSARFVGSEVITAEERIIAERDSANA